MRLEGKCTGGLSCDGGCCRSKIFDFGKLIEETYCTHYDKETGMCKVYDIREEKGYSGCISFPTVDCTLRNGLPKNCGFYLVED